MSVSQNGGDFSDFSTDVQNDWPKIDCSVSRAMRAPEPALRIGNTDISDILNNGQPTGEQAQDGTSVTWIQVTCCHLFLR